MTLVNTKPLRFSPQGLSDALAEEDAFPGACTSLKNLIPDPSTKNLWTPRPAAVSLTTFGSFSSPTGVVVTRIVGSYVFGLVSTSRFAGKDEPFCFNLLTNTFVTVTGITSGNVPTTQPTTGDWTPPTMDVMGNFVVVTHPGFDGVTNFIGWFDITVLTAPVWHAGNFLLQNVVTALTLTSGGTGYTNGSYTGVALSYIANGQGAGATANFTVAGGIVTVATLVNGGVDYSIGDQLTSAGMALGAGGAGLVLTVTAVSGAGISVITLVNGGTNYTAGSTFTNVPLTGGSGSGATGNFVTNGAGNVSSVTVNTPGVGYKSGDKLFAGGIVRTLTFTAGSGYHNGFYTDFATTGGTGIGVQLDVTVAGGHITSVVVSPIGSTNNPSYGTGNPTGGEGYSVGDSLLLTGSILSFTVTNNGSGFIQGTYNNVAISSTSGYGDTGGLGINQAQGVVTVSLIVDASLTCVHADSEKPNINFAVGDTITVNGAALGNSLSFVELTVAAIEPIIGTGSGYAVHVATIDTAALGTGTGFKAEVLTITPPVGFINFTTVPSWVRQFNGRSWFGINPPTGIPSVIFSDVYALNATNANQALSFGDNTPLTAAAPLGLANLLGGVVQALIIFKSLNGIIQVTGDATTNNLSVNQVPGGSGTISPRSLTEHPQGLLYLDHDGYRMVTLDGNCTDPIGVAGQGVVVPFLNPTTPTRVAAGCNGSILRVSVRTESGAWQAYWFDTVRKVWSGPHTDATTMYDTYQDTFILVSQASPAALFSSSTIPYAGENFTEFGSALTWAYQTTVLMDNMEMSQSEVAEMQVKSNSPAGITSIVVTAQDQDGAIIGTETYTFPSVSGIMAWPIDFSAPVVYNRLAIKITGTSVANFRIGDIYVRARVLRYRSALF